jgi:molecular chaperone GrpE
MTTDKQEEAESTVEKDQEAKEHAPVEEKQEDKEVTILASELEALKEAKKDFEQKYWLGLAETENSRKRIVKERDGDRRYAVQGVILDLLNPIDHLEKALAHSDNAPDEVQNWAIGFKMILTQFKDALTSHGVQPFHVKGEQFDPHRHDAVETIETDEVAPDTVVDELLQGYTIGDKILRPARVRVAKAPKVEETTDQQQNSGGIHDKEEEQ